MIKYMPVGKHIMVKHIQDQIYEIIGLPKHEAEYNVGDKVLINGGTAYDYHYGIVFVKHSKIVAVLKEEK